LPADDDTIRATVASVACAVHAKGKTALDVTMEIARAASAPIPDHLEDLAPGLHAALADRGGRRFNVVVDALDEATSTAGTTAGRRLRAFADLDLDWGLADPTLRRTRRVRGGRGR
jgi:hypothetical protein